MQTLGTLLRRFRNSKRLSQTEVATALGIHQTTYSDWEKDEGSPKWSQVIELAALFEQPAWVFLDDDAIGAIEKLQHENESLLSNNQRLSVELSQLLEELRELKNNRGGLSC
jgi:transcriptional regulator with XRE-family HTH domain